MTDLICNALETVRNLANTYLNSLDQRAEDWIALTNLVGPDGLSNPAAQDRIVMTVRGIEPEIVGRNRPAPVAGSLGGWRSAAALSLNVRVLFVANFTDRHYPDGLGALSRLLGFFQMTPVISTANAPGLAPEIERLTLDLETIPPDDAAVLVPTLGPSCPPYVAYRLRGIDLNSVRHRAGQGHTIANPSP